VARPRFAMTPPAISTPPMTWRLRLPAALPPGTPRHLDFLMSEVPAWCFPLSSRPLCGNAMDAALLCLSLPVPPLRPAIARK